MGTRVRRLDWAERWFKDGLAVCQPPSYFQTVEVDATRAKALILRTRTEGFQLTYTTLLVRAVAIVLKATPELHIMVCGNKMHHLGRVDIGLSVGGENAITPVLIIAEADTKSLYAVGTEIARRVPEVQDAERRLRAALCRWGWIVPFGFLRRALLHGFRQFADFRFRGSGTFQVSVVAGVDQVATPLFNTCGILTAGRVKDRVIAVEGKPVVRPTVNLTCSADHGMWNGKAGEKFLLAVRDLLETGNLTD